MFISKSCSYGIRSVAYLSGYPQGRYVPIRDISSDLNISYHFLTKILQMLTAANILISSRGAGGGVALAREAAAITLYDLIIAIDGDELFTGCLLRLPGCGTKTPCPMHQEWDVARGKVNHFCCHTSVTGLKQHMLLLAANPASDL
ncbi:MAG: Rrf2 family transcriptional regulator [Rhodothermaceae bacterium]|nr:Rrf2 family transcriptional regulator [Rhodothermaceae bacterium]